MKPGGEIVHIGAEKLVVSSPNLVLHKSFAILQTRVLQQLELLWIYRINSRSKYFPYYQSHLQH